MSGAVDTGREWRCFHCDEVFSSYECARVHFGVDELQQPGCVIAKVEERGLLGALRRAQMELAGYYQEDTEIDRYVHRLHADHGRKVREAEEAGYGKGVRDMAGERGVALAEAARYREALKAIDALPVLEINPSNYGHDDVCELNANAVQAALIARAALGGRADG